jgi:hypothetical protein
MFNGSPAPSPDCAKRTRAEGRSENAKLIAAAVIAAIRLNKEEIKNSPAVNKDFHLVLANPNDQSETIIGELPDPTCVANAAFAHGLTVMRSWMMSTFGAAGRTTLRLPQPVPVLVRGVVFYDFIHGQDGVAPNGIEIHPILGIGPPH